MVKTAPALKIKKQTAIQKTVDPTIGVKRKENFKKQKVGKHIKNKIKKHKNGSSNNVEENVLMAKKKLKKNVNQFHTTSKKNIQSYKKSLVEENDKQGKEVSLTEEDKKQFNSTNLKNKLKLNKKSSLEEIEEDDNSLGEIEEDDNSLEEIEEDDNSLEEIEEDDNSLEEIEEDDNSLEEIEEDDNSLEEIEEDDNSLEELSDVALMKGSKFMGDISEEDIDSDDDLSLDESELPLPPDVTTTEEESSEEEQDDIGPVDALHQPDEKEKRTIFVGNLPKSVNKSKLKKWFTKYGAVESVRLRCAPLADPTVSKKLTVIRKAFHEERNNIHGFVRFSCNKEAINALSANGEPFDETHHLRVDMAGLTNERKRHDDKKALFIGNLPFNAEEEQLRDIFADCGDILDVRIVRDKNTAVGKGFGFINFAGRHSVRLALEKDGIELKGRKLRLQRTFYNQELHDVHQTPKNNHRNNKSNRNLNSQKFKKIKTVKGNEGHEFQGLRPNRSNRSNKDMKPKKIREKRKREKIKKILNSKST